VVIVIVATYAMPPNGPSPSSQLNARYAGEGLQTATFPFVTTLDLPFGLLGNQRQGQSDANEERAGRQAEPLRYERWRKHAREADSAAEAEDEGRHVDSKFHEGCAL